MRDLLDFREHHVGGRGIVLVLVGADLAAAIPGEAEILAAAGDAIQLARRYFIAHAVDLVVVGPERLVLWIEVHADRVTQPDRVDFAILAVAVHADNAADAELAVQVELLLGRHVVRLPELNIELVVGTDAANAGSMIVAFFRFRDQLAFGNDNAGDDVGALVEEFGGWIFQHPVLLDDVEEAVL